MTAPARVTGPGSPSRTRNRTQAPQRERGTGKPATQPPDRSRSAAAERAYARRAQRTRRLTGALTQLKVERRPGSAGRATFVILVMALLVGGVVATLWFATQATADAYKLEQAKYATNQLQVRVGKLQQQVAQQDSPPSLAQRAQRLGMIPAPDPAHIVVGPDGKATVIGTPSVAVRPTTPPPPPPPSTTPSAPPSGVTTPSKPPTTTPTPPAGG
jgi:hypothetical protein